MGMQRYELEAWLGDDHGLADDQVDELLVQADEIDARHGDDQDAAREALTVAYQLMREDDADAIVADLAQRRAAAHAASAGLRQAAITLIPRGDATESGFARQAGVDRMTVRKWLGK